MNSFGSFEQQRPPLERGDNVESEQGEKPNEENEKRELNE
jgi:hypothetical protein